jgi:hypothetical protein
VFILIVLVFDTVILILMTILHYWFEFSSQHGPSECNKSHMTCSVANCILPEVVDDQTLTNQAIENLAVR